MAKSLAVRIAAALALAVGAATATAAPAHAAFPGSDGRLLFESPVADVCCELYTVRPDGTGLHQLTHFTPSLGAIQGSWSPDSRQIVFRAAAPPPDTFTPGQLWLMDADGNNQHLLLPDTDYFFNPSFSADGRAVVFSRCQPDFSSCAIFRVDTTGQNLTALTQFGHAGVQDFDPRYSPRGNKISFSSFNRGGLLGAVYLMNPDGTSVERVTPANIEGFLADWAPNAHTLAFVSNCCRPAASTIWKIRPNGSGLKQLTTPEPSADFKPVFAPAGDWIAFERLAPDASLPDLWIMRPDGSNPHLLRTQSDHVSWGSAA
jgi:Tol biopolymer transport system component